ncbi:MAG: HlyD family secretion protein [Thiobacillaceae bacterium]|jgi:multidrug resistance efflux pump|nr:HlyD family secretion protein [Thiobacillaceae bacterium]
MELLLLGIYAFFAWLIFFKFKWLPWNIISQVITITLPIIGLTVLILTLNVVAPSSADVRVINYVVSVNPRVAGLVTEVPIVPNRPIKKGDVLFRIDPTPFELDVKDYSAQLAQLRAQLVTAQANTRNLQGQLRAAIGGTQGVASKLELAKLRVKQFRDLSESGAGSAFDLEQAQADLANLQAQLDSAKASESQVREKLAAKTPDGDQDEVANVKAQIARVESQLANAKWSLEQTVYYAPADGTVVSLALRPGMMAVPFPALPAMNFVEDEQWILAIYNQNEVRKIEPGQEAEVAFRMHPGRVVKAKVDSIMWATAQGQLPIGGMNATSGVAPIPPNSLAVRLLTEGKDKDIFLASGARGQGAVYTESGEAIHILRKVILRIGAKLDWLILKLH